MNTKFDELDGIIRVDRVVAEYDIWLDASLFPFPKMRVKILERSEADFLAVANLRRRNTKTREPEDVAGLGSSADESLRDLLGRFVSEARQNLPPDGLVEADFEWSAPDDF